MAAFILKTCQWQKRLLILVSIYVCVKNTYGPCERFMFHIINSLLRQYGWNYCITWIVTGSKTFSILKRNVFPSKPTAVWSPTEQLWSCVFEGRQVLQASSEHGPRPLPWTPLNLDGSAKARAPVQPCTGHPGHQLHILNHTVELIQFIWPGSRYGAITSLLTECGGGATPECPGNGQSAQLIPLQEGRCGGGREGEEGLLFKDVGAKFD